MGLRARWAAAGTLAALVAASLVLAVGLPAGLQGEEYRAAVLKLYREVADGLEKVRGLKVPEAVRIEVVSSEWVRQEWGAQMEAAGLELTLKEAAYRGVLFLLGNESLAAAEVEWSGRILAAVVGRELYVVEDYFNPQDERRARRTLAHEIMHLIQGAHFPRFTLKLLDEELAWSALIEGDADFTANRYMAALSQGGGLPAAAGLPATIQDLKQFPYLYGQPFISALYEKEGWRAVDGAYLDPPRTTSEVLHPHLYLAGFEPLEVSAPRLMAGGWNTTYSNRMGEYFVQVLLSRWLDFGVALRASEGWLGDNLTLYWSPGVDVVVWRLEWNSTRDAAEFLEAYRTLLSRAGGVELSEGLWRVGGRHFLLAGFKTSTLVASSPSRELLGLIGPEVLKTLP